MNCLLSFTLELMLWAIGHYQIKCYRDGVYSLKGRIGQVTRNGGILLFGLISVLFKKGDCPFAVSTGLSP